MEKLRRLESISVHILREAYANFPELCMLWSIGKDSTVLLHLARKAFFGHVPFPLVHIDTGFKIPRMIEYRDELARKWRLNMIYGRNEEAIKAKRTYPDGDEDRISCCKSLKTDALKRTLEGKGPRYRLDHRTGEWVADDSGEVFRGVILGIRSDEEGSRSKERYFSARDKTSRWEPGAQAPEFWDQFNTDFQPGEHVRIHPLLDWTELDIWEYIKLENIPVVELYFDQGKGERYRSLGCDPCTFPVSSSAKDVDGIIKELKSGRFARVPERSGRAQDSEDGGGLETLRREGYM